MERLRKQVEGLAQMSARDAKGHLKGGGKGKDKNGKGQRPNKGESKACPAELSRHELWSYVDGKRVNRCYNFNMAGCSAAAAGQACARGMHECTIPGCAKKYPGEKHGARQCPHKGEFGF